MKFGGCGQVDYRLSNRGNRLYRGKEGGGSRDYNGKYVRLRSGRGNKRCNDTNNKNIVFTLSNITKM